jgi:hypothetical protein
VLTGVSDARAVLVAAERDRPRYLGADLGALDEEAEHTEAVARPPWRVEEDGTGLTLATDGSGTVAEPVAALRALCAVHWAAGGGQTSVRAGDDAAADALRALGLADDH